MALVREGSGEQNYDVLRQRFDVLLEAERYMEQGTEPYVQPATVAASSVVAAQVTPDTNPYFDQRQQDYDLAA
jgi:hypothetical protein